MSTPNQKDFGQAIDNIAKICHEANRALCSTIMDDSQVPWEEAPEWQKIAARNGVRFHMTGDHSPSASHENWMKEKIADGWVYGPVKDPEAKKHPLLVPFSELDGDQQAKDYLFRAIVHAFKQVLFDEVMSNFKAVK